MVVRTCLFVVFGLLVLGIGHANGVPMPPGGIPAIPANMQPSTDCADPSADDMVCDKRTHKAWADEPHKSDMMTPQRMAKECPGCTLPPTTGARVTTYKNTDGSYTINTRYYGPGQAVTIASPAQIELDNQRNAIKSSLIFFGVVLFVVACFCGLVLTVRMLIRELRGNVKT